MRSASCRHRRNNRRRRRLPVSIPLAAIAISVANIARANRALERDLRSLRAGGGGGGSSDSAQSRPRRKLQMVRTADTLRGNGTTTATAVPRLPNVLLIGAQKAGSTALAHWLYDRGVCKPKRFGNEPPFYRKEVHFFDDDGRYAMGEHFYAHRFGHCYGNNGGTSNATSWAMDATPATLRHAHRVRETYEAAGRGQADAVKILVILRDPVARDLSLYNHMTHKYRNRRPGHEEPYFMDLTGGDDKSVISYAEYVDRVTLRSINATDGSCRVDHVNSMSCLGLYAYYLKQWMDLFDRRRQILILSHDELRRDGEALLGRVSTFLGLSSVKGTARHPGGGALRAANTKDGGEKVVLAPCPVRDGLDQAFGIANEALYRLLRERPGPPMEQVPFPKFALSNCTSLRQPS